MDNWNKRVHQLQAGVQPWEVAAILFDQAYEYYMSPKEIDQHLEKGWKMHKLPKGRSFKLLKILLKNGSKVKTVYVSSGRHGLREQYALYRGKEVKI